MSVCVNRYITSVIGPGAGQRARYVTVHSQRPHSHRSTQFQFLSFLTFLFNSSPAAFQFLFRQFSSLHPPSTINLLHATLTFFNFFSSSQTARHIIDASRYLHRAHASYLLSPQFARQTQPDAQAGRRLRAYPAQVVYLRGGALRGTPLPRDRAPRAVRFALRGSFTSRTRDSAGSAR